MNSICSEVYYCQGPYKLNAALFLLEPSELCQWLAGDGRLLFHGWRRYRYCNWRKGDLDIEYGPKRV